MRAGVLDAVRFLVVTAAALQVPRLLHGGYENLRIVMLVAALAAPPAVSKLYFWLQWFHRRKGAYTTDRSDDTGYWLWAAGTVSFWLMLAVAFRQTVHSDGILEYLIELVGGLSLAWYGLVKVIHNAAMRERFPWLVRVTEERPWTRVVYKFAFFSAGVGPSLAVAALLLLYAYRRVSAFWLFEAVVGSILLVLMISIMFLCGLDEDDPGYWV